MINIKETDEVIVERIKKTIQKMGYEKESKTSSLMGASSTLADVYYKGFKYKEYLFMNTFEIHNDNSLQAVFCVSITDEGLRYERDILKMYEKFFNSMRVTATVLHNVSYYKNATGFVVSYGVLRDWRRTEKIVTEYWRMINSIIKIFPKTRGVLKV